MRVDLPVQILALFGLAFLLFLAGLEIDVRQLRGRLLRLAPCSAIWPRLVLGLRHRRLRSRRPGAVSEPLMLAITLSSRHLAGLARCSWTSG